MSKQLLTSYLFLTVLALASARRLLQQRINELLYLQTQLIAYLSIGSLPVYSLPVYSLPIAYLYDRYRRHVTPLSYDVYYPYIEISNLGC
ncbi:hypothetical protein F5Y04DRAFT_169066 [Hypomontagnella monticulosa]|nr:hypothetical protein F5Y04DRAFT_169066 [Hypomontagnella monticulosa]